MARQGSDPCAGHPGSVSSLAPRSSHREFPFSEVFFQIAQILFLALQLYCPSCTCLYCEVCSPPVPAQSFPYEKALFLILETAVSSCSEQAFEHSHVPLRGISSNLFLLAYYATLLLGSTSGQMSSQTSDGEWKGTLSCQQNCSAPMNHLFLKLVYLGLFIPNVRLQYKFGIHCNPAENLYLNHFSL